jgi:DNA-directed RNA polymerase subunit RPC12/RpoP
MGRLNEKHLNDVAQCPYCGIANPTLASLWQSAHHIPRATPGSIHRWGVYYCTSCGGVVLAKGKGNAPETNAIVEEIIPAPKTAHKISPSRLGRFYSKRLKRCTPRMPPQSWLAVR